MRVVRFFAVVLAISFAAGTASCRRAESADPAVAPSPAIPTTTVSAEVSKLPAGDWKAPGDLCKIITGKIVSEMFEFSETELIGGFDKAYAKSGAWHGIDYCSYYFLGSNGTTKHSVISVSIGSTSNKKWKDTLTELTSNASEVTKFTINGIDEAIYVNYEAGVRAGDVSAWVHPNTTGSFDKTRLAKLAAMAIQVVS